jgi:hypothetical protein
MSGSQIKEYPFDKRGMLGMVLPDEQWIVLNASNRRGILTLMGNGESRCRIIAQEMITDQELFLVVELFDQFPEFCPYAELMSALTGREIEACRQEVIYALEHGTIDAVMRPVRNVLSRCRVRLHPLGIEIKSVVETGYVLAPFRKGRWQFKGKEEEL